MRVVIAAGGLGTRVAGWAQLLPKEFQPVDGRPALVVLLEELAGAGAEQAVLVYHRYYEPFIGWAAHALDAGGTGRYRAAAGLPSTAPPAYEGLRLRFVRQHGMYADITSVLNAAAPDRTSCGCWKAGSASPSTCWHSCAPMPAGHTPPSRAYRWPWQPTPTATRCTWSPPPRR